MAEQNLTPEEIQEIKKVKETQEKLIGNFGELEFQIQNLELQKEKLVEQLEQYKTQEINLANKLSKKYGNGTIDVEKGIITS